MKKFCVAFLVLALVAGNAFAADVYTGIWGRAAFLPVEMTSQADGDVSGLTAYTKQWGVPAELEAEFAWSGDHIGATIDYEFSNPAMLNGSIWWRPLSQFRLNIGRATWNVLRGPDTMESFAGRVGFGDMDVENVFPRFNTRAGWQHPTAGGAIFEITPIDNVYIGAAIANPTEFAGDLTNNDVGTTEISDIYQYSQYAAGYSIDGIGLIRAGYFGTRGAFAKEIAAAFKLTAVENLGLDVGFQYGTDQPENTNNVLIGLAVNYAIPDTANINFYANVKLGGDKDKAGKDGATHLAFFINPELKTSFADIGLGFGFGTYLDVENSSYLGGDLYVNKNIGGGAIKGGVIFTRTPNKDDPAKGDILFAVPIEITVSIW
jgi:hypothetical protein